MSNVIKSNRYVPLADIRKLEAYIYHVPEPENPREETGASAEQLEEKRKAEKQAEQLLSDAKAAADEMLREAMEDSQRKREEAEADIESWWRERRAEDEAVVEEHRRAGYESGYSEGFGMAEANVKEQYKALIGEARQLVEEAHEAKERIIAESEPFLVELSTAVAGKIIGEHLAVHPEWTITHVMQTLRRRRERGLITLLVSPREVAKIQDVRDELQLVLDSEAELVIVPDTEVQDGGCIVRTSFGSIDARIDTQLAELKAALMEVAAQPDEGAVST